MYYACYSKVLLLLLVVVIVVVVVVVVVVAAAAAAAAEVSVVTYFKTYANIPRPSTSELRQCSY